jgi:sugar phosphate isomerase/epimerase
MFASWNARAVGLSATARQSIEAAGAAGFGGVDLLVRDVVDSRADVQELRARMDDLGLRGGAWPLPVRWRGDPDRFTEELKRLPIFAGVAARLGLTRTGTWVLPEVEPSLFPERRAPHLLEATVALHVERLGAIATILADHGCRLGLEIMGPARARRGRHPCFIKRYADLEPLLGELREGHQNVGILADSFHLYAAGERAKASLIWGAGAITWVHVSDPANADSSQIADHERDLPGVTGLGDCRGLLQLLLKADYTGPVTAEPLGPCPSLKGMDEQTAAKHTAGALRTVWPEQASWPGHGGQHLRDT